MSHIDEFYITNDLYGRLNRSIIRNNSIVGNCSYANLGYEVEARVNHKLEEPSKIYYLRWLTISFDILLMGCGTCLFASRWYFFPVVLDVYVELGAAFIIFGGIYLSLGPLGMIGAGKHKAILLTLHNIGLLLTLCANAIILYTIYWNGHTLDSSKYENSLLKVELIRSTVDCKLKDDMCCCHLPNWNEHCWQNSTLTHNDEYDCTSYLDEEVERIKEIGHYFFPISMIAQGLAMISGYFVVMCKNRFYKTLIKQAHNRP